MTFKDKIKEYNDLQSNIKTIEERLNNYKSILKQLNCAISISLEINWEGQDFSGHTVAGGKEKAFLPSEALKPFENMLKQLIKEKEDQLKTLYCTLKEIEEQIV